MKKIFAVVGIITMLVGFTGCGATEQTYEAEPEYDSNGKIKETGYVPYREVVDTGEYIWVMEDGEFIAEIRIHSSNGHYLYWYSGQYYQTEEEARAAIKFN